MANKISLSVPNLKGNELQYITQAVEAEWVSTGGPFITQFEQNLAAYVNVPEAVACQSGTAGLHLALQEVGVGYGDLVLVPTVTFIAAVNPVTYLGAEPVFFDCDDGLCIDPVMLRTYCEQACELRGETLYEKESGRRVSAIVPVHVFGNIADMEGVMDVARDYHLKVVEDATEALGSRFTTGRYAGQFAGTIGDVGVYSFNGNKIITTGGGGMLVARDPAQLAHMRKLSIQAKASESDHFYDHDEIGYNYRMTNVQAALGVAQLEQLDTFIETKRRNYELYRELELNLMPYRDNVAPNYWFYALLTNGRVREMMDALAAQDIETRPIWKLIHTLKPYQHCRAYQIEKAYRYYDNVLNLPCSTNLPESDVRRVAQAVQVVAGY